MTGRRAGRGGFTLLEVAVALAILGAGVVTCLQIFSGSLQLQSRASRQVRVAMAARGYMDALFAQPVKLGCVAAPPNPEGFAVRYCVSEATAEDGIVLPDGFDTDQPLPLRLQVDVTWQDATGEKTYTLQTLRFDDPERRDLEEDEG